MSSKRRFRLVAVSITAASISAVGLHGSCGGTPETFFDEAGAYHLPDGAVLSPGSACVGFDASLLVMSVDPGRPWSPADLPQFACDGAVPDKCVGLFVPPSFVGDQGCEPQWPDGGKCLFRVGGMSFPHCTPGSSGDQFCRAFFQQFVTDGGIAQARCATAGSYGSFCTGTCCALCVKRGSMPEHCEWPCQ